MNTSQLVCAISLAAALFIVQGCGMKPRDTREPAAQVERPDEPSHPQAHWAPHIHEGWQPMEMDEAMAILDDRPAWTDHGPITYPRHPAERFLEGWTIVLDPGHGGEDGGDLDPRPRYKAGPTAVKEAHMNLRVGLLLKRLLEEAGVNVIMTREGDDTIGLRERAEVANKAPRPDGGTGADLFISIHHNAVGNPETNYTSVWYHGQVDWAEPDLDVAKYIAHQLNLAMRTDAARTSPLFSDQQMYRSGFGMLRQTTVPAILLECSFFTHPQEEQRLRDAGYNLRQAYAVYLGLCEYAYGGRPTQQVPRVTVDASQVFVETTLDDGLPGNWWGADRNRIITSSIALLLDDERIDFSFDPQSKRIESILPLDVERLAEQGGDHVLSIHHANMFKHHNWPQRYRVRFEPAAEDGQVRAEVTQLPPIRAARAEGPGPHGAPVE